METSSVPGPRHQVYLSPDLGLACWGWSETLLLILEVSKAEKRRGGLWLSSIIRVVCSPDVASWALSGPEEASDGHPVIVRRVMAVLVSFLRPAPCTPTGVGRSSVLRSPLHVIHGCFLFLKNLSLSSSVVGVEWQEHAAPGLLF